MARVTFAWIQTVHGTYSFTPPVPVIRVQAWASSGGSGGSGGSSDEGAGGGGSGEYAEEPQLAVTAGSALTVVVGAGGTAGSSSTAGGNGTNTTIGGTLVVANAGQGGGKGTGSAGAGGAKGTGSSNTIHHDGAAGGSGGSSKSDGGGGGASSAGPAAAGNPGSASSSSGGGAAGATVTGGGPGAAGAGTATAGIAPSGGPGGGAGGAGGGGSLAGAAGADGQVIITWAQWVSDGPMTRPRPPAPRRGSAQGSPGASILIAGTPPPFYAPVTPARQIFTRRKGKMAGSAGAPVTIIIPTPAPFASPSGPMARLFPRRKGRIQSAPGAPVIPVVPTPAPFAAPERALRRMEKLRRPLMQGAPGAPVIPYSPAVFTPPVRPLTALFGRRKGKMAGRAGSPVTIVTAPHVVNQWSGSTTSPPVFGPMPPGCASTVIALDAASSVGDGSGVPTEGNWLFCIAGWNQSSGASAATVPAATISVGDDTHMWWRPAPPSSSEGGTRTTIWYQPNILPPEFVYVAPTAYAAGWSVLVIEVAGLGPWDTVAGIDTNDGNGVTSLALSLGAPGAPAFFISAATGSLESASTHLAPSGWTTLETVSASNGTDTSSDTVLVSACRASSSAQSVTATGSSENLSGMMLAVLQNGPSPVPAGINPNWPYLIFEAAFGSGYGTPPDQMTWTNLQAPANGQRLRKWADSTGSQYELDALEASETQLDLLNPDGNLSPGDASSPWYPNVVPGTPVRIRAVPPATTGADRWYVLARNMERWPQTWDALLRGASNATGTDMWSVVNKTLPTCYRAEVLADAPGWWWPCDDSGANAAEQLNNAAPASSSPLLITTVNGPAVNIANYPFPSAVTYSAVTAFAQATGWMYGDPVSAAFQQSGNGDDAHGYFLWCTDDFPPLSGDGATIEGWWNFAYWDPDGQGFNEAGLFGQPGGTSSTGAQLILWQIQGPSLQPVAELSLAASTGELVFTTYSTSGTPTSTTLETLDKRDQSWIGATISMSTTQGWVATVNAGAISSASAQPSSWEADWSNFYAIGGVPSSGPGLAGVQAGCGNAMVSHLAIYPYVLPQQRVMAHQMAAYTAFGQLPPPSITSSFIANPGSGSPSAFDPAGKFESGQAFGAPGDGNSSLAAVACAIAGSYTSAPSAPVTVLTILPTDGGPGFCWLDAGQDTGGGGGGSFPAPLYQWYAGSARGAALAMPATASGHPYQYVDAFGAGAAPPTVASALGDTVQGRIERLLQAGNATGPRCIDPASAAVLAALDTGGQACGDAVGNITTSDDGLLYIDALGYLCYWQRSHLASQATAWVLGPNLVSGQIPFEFPAAGLDTDPQQVKNDIAVTQFDVTEAGSQAQSGLSSGSAEPAGGLVYAPDASLYAEVQASQVQNGDCQYEITSYLQSATLIQSQADWLFDTFGSPVQRITSLTVNAASKTRTCPQAWLFVLSANVGDLIQAVYTYPGQHPVVGTWRISHIDRTIDWAAGTASVQVAADVAPTTFWGVPAMPIVEDETGATLMDEQGGWLE